MLRNPPDLPLPGTEVGSILETAFATLQDFIRNEFTAAAISIIAKRGDKSTLDRVRRHATDAVVYHLLPMGGVYLARFLSQHGDGSDVTLLLSLPGTGGTTLLSEKLYEENAEVGEAIFLLCWKNFQKLIENSALTYILPRLIAAAPQARIDELSEEAKLNLLRNESQGIRAAFAKLNEGVILESVTV